MKERREGRSTLVEGVVAADLVGGSGKGGWKWGGDLEFVIEFTMCSHGELGVSNGLKVHFCHTHHLVNITHSYLSPPLLGNRVSYHSGSLLDKPLNKTA
jgi:hypothetical protein